MSSDQTQPPRTFVSPVPEDHFSLNQFPYRRVLQHQDAVKACLRELQTRLLEADAKIAALEAVIQASKAPKNKDTKPPTQ